jgi:hypothetical protein
MAVDNFKGGYTMFLPFKKMSPFVILIMLLTFSACNAYTDTYDQDHQDQKLENQEGHQVRNRLWMQDIMHFSSAFLGGGHQPFIGSSSHLPTLMITLDCLYNDFVDYANSQIFEDPPHHTFIGPVSLIDSSIRDSFREKMNTLMSNIPYLTDFEIEMALWRSIAITSDSHLNIIGPSRLTQRLPFATSLLFDNLYSEDSYPYPWPHITGVSHISRDFLNTRLVAINGVDIDEIFNRLRPIFPHENEFDFRSLANLRWRFLCRRILQYIGVVDAYDEFGAPVSVTVKDSESNILTMNINFVTSFNVTYGHRHYRHLSFFQQQNIPIYEFVHTSEERMMHVRLSLVYEDPRFHSTQFKKDIINTLIKNNGVDTFVLDVRNNPGGRLLQGFSQLLYWAQAEENRALMGDVYIAIDSDTFSAATIIAFLFRNFINDAILIGSPAGGGLNFFGESGVVSTLPNSNIQFFGTTNHFALDPYSETNTLYPDIFVHQTLEDFIGGRDVVLEAIRQRRINSVE